jgi:hypothetical protein
MFVLEENTLNWALVIERNRDALKPIIEVLFAMLGLVTRLPVPVYRRVLRLLKPAESAVRRLIVIAARGVVVKPVVPRPKPVGPITGKGKRSGFSFPLFDTRKSFPQFQQIQKRKVAKVAPRFYLVGSDPPGTAPWYAQPCPVAPAVPAPPPLSDGLVDGARITRRLQALQSALADLPRQAKRLARWRLKRANISHLKMRYPMRPGRAPGYRKKKTHEIDEILGECHYFAWEAMKKPDTS